MNSRLKSVKELASRFESGDNHPKQVTSIALEIYDSCELFRGKDESERELLQFAGLLHDIGWVDGRQQHHKRACELILDNPPDKLTARETAMVANIARYHRKALPSLDHAEYAKLAESDKEIVNRLSAILRVADGLDVTHSNQIRFEKCLAGKDKVIFKLKCSSNCSYEIAQATKKADLFREVFKKNIEFKY